MASSTGEPPWFSRWPSSPQIKNLLKQKLQCGPFPLSISSVEKSNHVEKCPQSKPLLCWSCKYFCRIRFRLHTLPHQSIGPWSPAILVKPLHDTVQPLLITLPHTLDGKKQSDMCLKPLTSSGWQQLAALLKCMWMDIFDYKNALDNWPEEGYWFGPCNGFFDRGSLSGTSLPM